MRNIKLITTMLLLTMNIFSGIADAVPVVEWSMTFEDGRGVNSASQTSDQGYILTMTPFLSLFGSDASILKTDALGKKEWIRTLEKSSTSVATYAEYTYDGYIVSGYGNQPIGEIRGWLIKTDPSGKESWKKVVEEDSKLFSVEPGQDGKYVAAGNAGTSDAVLIRINASGKTSWKKKFAYNKAVNVVQPGDGGYVIGVNPSAIIRTDSIGNQIWKKTFSTSDMENLKSVQLANDLGYIVVGYDNLGNGQLLKTDNFGEKQWSKKYRGIYPWLQTVTKLNTVIQTINGEYILGGTSQYDSTKGLLIKTNSIGGQIWAAELGETINSIEKTKDFDGYIVAGICWSKACIMKISDQLTYEWKKIGEAGFSKEVLVGHNSATGDTHIYSVHNATGDIYKYNDVPVKNWTKIGGPGKKFATLGSDIFKLSSDGSNISIWDDSLEVWTKVGGPAGNIYGGEHSIIYTHPTTGDVYKYNGIPFSWTKIGGPGKTFAIGNGNLIYGISPDGGSIWKWDGIPNKWTQIGGRVDNIYASGTSLYTSGYYVHKYNNIPFSWIEIGYLRITEAGIGGGCAVTSSDILYCSDPYMSRIYKWSGVPDKWANIQGDFMNFVKKMSGGSDGDLLGVGWDNSVWRYRETGSIL